MKCLCPISVLRSLYHSLFNSHLSYGLVVWGNASRWNLEKIRSLQKRVLRLTAPGHNGDFNHILSDLNFRPRSSVTSAIIVIYVGLRSRYSTHVSKTAFKRVNLVHNYSTRSAIKGNLYYSKVYTSKYSIKSFKYQGIKILNYLKSIYIYQNAISKSFFQKQLKAELLSTYLTK